MVKSNLFQFSILSTFQNFDFQVKKNTKIFVKFLGKNSFFSAKIWKLSFSKPCQGVTNYESINSQSVSNILFVEFQGVMSFKYPIFSVKLQELIP